MNEKEFRNLYLPTRFIDVKNYAQVEKEFKQNLDSFKATIVQAEREKRRTKALEYLLNNIEDFGKKTKYADDEKGWVYNCVSLAVATNVIKIMEDEAIRED